MRVRDLSQDLVRIRDDRVTTRQGADRNAVRRLGEVGPADDPDHAGVLVHHGVEALPPARWIALEGLPHLARRHVGRDGAHVCAHHLANVHRLERVDAVLAHHVGGAPRTSP